MVARNTKSGTPPPYYNVHVELDNKALKAKNTGLTQTVTKLQQENADLLKQITLLQGESFEVNSKYNNLKNVISIIDSTTKTCLPKLTEVVDTFTGIIQLCSVAANISNSNRDTRTQAVKPQIVNGHVLHNPTITLSRLEGNENSFTPPRTNTHRNGSNVTVRPSTSRLTSETNDRSANMSDNESDSEDENSGENNGTNEMEEHDVSIRCQANRGVYSRRQTFRENGMSRLQEDDSDNSDEESEMPVEEEENEDEDSQQRLKTIPEVEEEEEEDDPQSPCTPRSKQRRFLKGRLQEVRIYLNQLPDTCVEQFRASGNISISLSPPERRSSYKNRSSSLVGEVNESVADNGLSFLEENLSPISKRDREVLSFNGGQSNMSVSFNLPLSATSSATVEDVRNCSDNSTLQNSQVISGDMATPSTSRVTDSSDESKSLTMKGLNLDATNPHDETSALQIPASTSSASLSLSNNYESPSTSNKSETSLLKNNITKRRNPSKDKRKVAQVMLKRLSGERGNSNSPIQKIIDIVNSPPITKLSEMRTRSRNSNRREDALARETSPSKITNIVKIEGGIKKRKNDSPVRKVGNLKKDNVIKPSIIISSPKKYSPGRPKRAARPKTMKEPSLVKKMRRSK